MTTVNKIEEGRAAFAFQEVKAAVNNNKINNGELRSYIKRMPTMIQVNGLGQALAFYYSKKGTYSVVYQIVEKWIVQQKLKDLFEGDGYNEFVERVINLNSHEYKLVTNETIALLNWLRRFVEGMVQEEKNGGN